MHLSEYFETLVDPLFALVDFALERPGPMLALVSAALATVFLAG